MTIHHPKAPIIANRGKNGPKNNKSGANSTRKGASSAAADVPTQLFQLQIEYFQKEHSIKMKAIADREAAELSLARKEYDLLRSRITGNKADADEICFDGVAVDEDALSDQDYVSPPIAFAYASSSSSSTAPRISPTPQQVCARQVMPADLPLFHGNPEDWPVFYSQYKNTTMACGYSNSENMIRLQRCLKGQALEFVRSRLLLPNLVPKVIETLKMLYGRPTLIINSLINKVRTTQPPEMDQLDSIINYGMAIRNLVDHLIAMEQTAHLQNPSLLQELVAKLPGEMKLQWAQYKRQHESSSLNTLCDFMNELVQDACEVTDIGSKARRNDDDSGSESFEDAQPLAYNTFRSCLVCRNQHSVQDCDEFKSLEVSRRWRLVGELKLCRCCLNRRHVAGVCQNAYECGIERCQLLHHPLLHQSRAR